jgi:hypothetical protein
MNTTPSPIIIDAAQTRASLPFDRLIAALREAFTVGRMCRCGIIISCRSRTARPRPS